MSDTKDKILDTAERLFAEQGSGATALRQVISEAGVNVAAVHYHFGSKEDLLDAVIQRKVAPVNEARLVWLSRLEAEAGDGALDVERVLEAFLLPMVETAAANPDFVRLMGRIFTEGIMPSLFEKHFLVTAMRFIGALKRGAPHVSEEEMLWRVHFMIGAVSHTICRAPIFPHVEPSVDAMELRLRRLVKFVAAGFRASATTAGSAPSRRKAKEK